MKPHVTHMINWLGDRVTAKIRRCPFCGGTGTYQGKKCDNCGGSGSR